MFWIFEDFQTKYCLLGVIMKKCVGSLGFLDFWVFLGCLWFEARKHLSAESRLCLAAARGDLQGEKMSSFEVPKEIINARWVPWKVFCLKLSFLKKVAKKGPVRLTVETGRAMLRSGTLDRTGRGAAKLQKKNVVRILKMPWWTRPKTVVVGKLISRISSCDFKEVFEGARGFVMLGEDPPVTCTGSCVLHRSSCWNSS